MNFEINKVQKQIQKAVKDFVKGEFSKDVIEELVFNHQFPEDIWKKASELGILGIHYPEQYGGQGLGMLENALVAEALCRGDSSVGMCLSRAGLGAELILRYGDETQKETWLPQIADARKLSCPAFTEPGLGNDIARSQTIAVQDGDAWIIEGTKTFVINSGRLSGLYIVLCRTDSEASSAGRRMSTILVEADRDGIAARDVGHRIGGWLMPLKEVQFNRVRVPLSHLIGKKNQGLNQITAYFNESRIMAAAQSVGIALGAFDRALKWVKQREQFGRKLVDFQVTRQKLSDMATSIEAARALTYQAAWHFDNGRGKAHWSAMAKLLASRTAVSVCDEAIQLLGGYGYIQDYEVERCYRDSKFADIFDGVRITQKEVIAEELVKGRVL